MASKIKVDQIEGSTGTTVSLPSGQTLDLSSGSVTLPNTSVSNAQLAGSIDLSTKVTGTLASGNLPTIPVSKGGTGVTLLGTAGQVIQVNSGATALEFATASSGTNVQMDYGHFTNTGSTIETTTSTHNDTGFGVLSVTPSTTGAKVYLSWSTSAWTSSGSYAVEFFVYRQIAGGGYSLISPNNTWGLSHVDTTSISATSIHWNDAPNTTSQVDYKLYFNIHNGGGTGSILRDQATATRSLICIN